MAVAHVQNTPNVAIASSTLASTFPANTTVGNVICVQLDCNVVQSGANACSVAGAGVTTWTQVPNTAGATFKSFWYGVVATSGAATVTITSTAGNFMGLSAAEFSGVSTTLIDHQVNDRSNTAPVAVGTLTPTAVGQLIFIGNGNNLGNANSPYTPGGVWTSCGHVSFGGVVNGDFGASDYLISTSTTAVSPTYPYSSGSGTAAGGFILDASSGGGTVNGTATVSLGPLTLTSTGVNTVKGTVTLSLGPLALTATGIDTGTGTATLPLGPLTLAATGHPIGLGVASLPLGPLTTTVTGTVTGLGTVTLALGPITLSATGTVAGTVSGTSAIPLGPLTLTATGTIPASGTINGTSLISLGPVLLITHGNVIGIGTYARIKVYDSRYV